MKKLTAISLSIALAACGKTIITKPGASAEQVNRDIWECQREGVQTASSLFGPDGALLFGREYQMQCLAARGYSAARK